MSEWLDATGEQMGTDRFLEMLSRDGGEVHVGSDSHLVGGEWLFATAVCVYREGMGGNFCYRRHRFSKDSYRGLYDRLMQETTLSILAAEEIRTMTDKKVTIHADVALSDSPSSRYKKQVENFVKSMGFPVLTKPESWASSSVADKKAR